MSKKKRTKAGAARANASVGKPVQTSARAKKELIVGLQSLLVPALLQALPVALSGAQPAAVDRPSDVHLPEPAAAARTDTSRPVAATEQYLAGIDSRMSALVGRISRLNSRISAGSAVDSQKANETSPGCYMECLGAISEKVELAHALMDCIEQNV